MGIVCGEVFPELFQSVFSSEPTRLTENKMEWPDFIASHFWEVITAMLLQLIFSQFHACKKVKVTETECGWPKPEQLAIRSDPT